MRAKRANVNLEIDAYNFAVTYASAKGMPLGAAISDLIRRAETAPEAPSPRLTTNRRGLLIKAKAGRVLHPETVRRMSEADPD